MARSRNGVGFDADAAIRAAMSDIRSGLGTDDHILFANEAESAGRLSTGSAALDHMLGGGIPLGRITHMPGPPGSGRTTLVYAMIAQAQADGKRCVYVDADHRFNGLRAASLGVDTAQLVLVKPRTVEQAFMAIERLVSVGVFALVVLDSVGSMTPNAEYQGDFGDSHPGLLDKWVEQGCRKLIGSLGYYGTALVVTNQYRTDHRVVFGSGRVAPGEVDNFATLTLDVSRTELLRRKTDQPVVAPPDLASNVETAIAGIIAEAESVTPASQLPAEDPDQQTLEAEPETFGIRIRVKVTQNSEGPAYRTAHVHIVFDQGISREGDLIELGAALGVLFRSGAKYYFGETLLGTHEAGAAEFLRENSETALEIEAEILRAQEKARG